MDYCEFIKILKDFNFKMLKHSSCGLEFYSWYNEICVTGFNVDLHENSCIVSYVIDKSGIIRQQFGSSPNIVTLLIRKSNDAGYYKEYKFIECINKIIENKLVEISIIRDFNLNKLDIYR